MGLFGNLFGGDAKLDKKEKKTLPWIPLTAVEQLIEIEKKSISKTQVIFKHSTSCGISRMVMNMFNRTYDFSETQIDLYYLDLHAYREVSNEAGHRFQVMHQSPQLLIIKNGTTVAHASHGAISELELSKYV